MNPPEVPTPGIAGGGKLTAKPSGSFEKLLVHVMHDFLILCGAALTVLPVVKRDEKEAGVTGVDEAQQAEAETLVVYLTPGVCSRICSTFRARPRYAAAMPRWEAAGG